VARLRFGSASWRERFEQWGWADFDTLWDLQADTVEPPNVRRGGWSSVVRIQAPDGTGLYLKRQVNHDFRDRQDRLAKRPTVSREWQVAAAFRDLGLAAAEMVCLGVDQQKTSRGLLMTVALDGFKPLTEVLQAVDLRGSERRDLWETLADVVKRFHDAGFRHNCLYGQHLFVRTNADGGWEIRLIDLEKATRTRRRKRAIIADLSALERHTEDMSHRDRQWFWDRYFRDLPLAGRRGLLLTLARRSATRAVDQYLRDCAAGRRD
jgi:hypothetical protein